MHDISMNKDIIIIIKYSHRSSLSSLRQATKKMQQQRQYSMNDNSDGEEEDEEYDDEETKRLKQKQRKFYPQILRRLRDPVTTTTQRPQLSFLFRIFADGGKSSLLDNCLGKIIRYCTTAKARENASQEWVEQLCKVYKERKEQPPASKLYFIIHALRQSSELRATFGVPEKSTELALVNRAFDLFIQGVNRTGRPPKNTTKVYAGTWPVLILKLNRSIIAGLDLDRILPVDSLPSQQQQQQLTMHFSASNAMETTA